MIFHDSELMKRLSCYFVTWLIVPVSLLAARAGADEPGAHPRSPREELAAFELADPALTIELVAAEPEVTSPVAITWDEDGRLYVAEMIDYPLGPAQGRIRRLEDRDKDGRYEQATVFADALPYPNGVLPCFGGLLVTGAPDIWFFRDLDEDGRADERIKVLTGFGEGNPQLRVNGLAWGLDNMIYAANGRSDGEVRAPGDPPQRSVSIRQRDVRFRLTQRPGSLIRASAEAIAGLSQFGLAHDDWGNRFPSWNTVPLRHVVLEHRSLERNPFLAEASLVASVLDPSDGGRIYAISPAQARFNRESVAFFNASCGPAIERGDALPASYHGNAFVCEPLTNLVHRRLLVPAGVTFVARRAEQGREFLASRDPAFRPVNLATGPDGALYVVDMYRELVEHPAFVPEPARGAVDFRRWHDRGRIWRVRPESPTPPARVLPGLSRASLRELVDLLGHPGGWWRQAAQRLLVERQDQRAVPLLRAALFQPANPLARLHALWAMAGLDAIDAASLARTLRDPHAGLREHALRVADSVAARRHTQLLATHSLIALADDPEIRVRFQAALALGDRCRGEPEALAALARIAARDASDPWMRLAIASGLRESALAFLLLCDQVPVPAGRSELVRQAASIVGARRDEAEIERLLELIVTRLPLKPLGLAPPGIDVSFDALTLAAGLAAGLERSGPPLHALIASPPHGWKPLLEQLAPLWARASTLATSQQPAAQRLVALDVLARGRPDLAEGIIPRLLQPTGPQELQIAAARAVALAGRPVLAENALADWNSLTLATRRELLAALAGSPALTEVLYRAITRQTIRPGELDASTRQAMERLPDSALKREALSILARFAPQPRWAVLKRYRAALTLAGDVRRGASVFARHCLTCHQHQGQGHGVGPDLSGIAGRAPDALLNDILNPNAEIAPDFTAIAVATHAGQVFTGLLADENATTVKLRRAGGLEDTLLRSQVEQIRSTGQSLMPEGFEQALGLQDMADLIAFLRAGEQAAPAPR
jgi:putative membrane-bound dehydrogenase-like protein